MPPVPSKPSKWPSYSPSEQEVLLGFLSGYRLHAMRAFEAAETMFRISPETPGYEGGFVYWRSVCKAIDWLISAVPKRHQHLWVLNYLKSLEEKK